MQGSSIRRKQQTKIYRVHGTPLQHTWVEASFQSEKWTWFAFDSTLEKNNRLNKTSKHEHTNIMGTRYDTNTFQIPQKLYGD